MPNKPTVIAVMPAYNAAKTLKKTLDDIPKGVIDKVILVDDNSRDDTADLAKKYGLQVYRHPQNRGYGGNQKTCYTMALNEGADVVVMIHPDYQYDSSLAREMVQPILENRFDIMFGSRIRSRAEALAGGMPAYKYAGNRFLTFLENIILGQNLSEYHTGYRAYSRQILKKIPFHRYSDDFVFDQHLVFGALAHGARIGEIAVPVRYFEEASSINFMRSVVYGLSILRDLGLHLITGGKYFK
ncbi:MAG TPA: glycosyltransferase family 2 protein [Patescibacteria group bacterium]